MKKILVLIATVSVLVLMPFLANGQVQSQDQTQTKTYSEDADGVRERIRNLNQVRETLREQEKEEIGEAAKRVGARLVDNLAKKYTALENRITNITVLSEAQKTALKADIQAEVVKLDGLKVELAAATDIESVKLVTAKIRTQVRTSQGIVKGIVQAIHLNHYANLLERLNTVYDKLAEKITKLKADGTDTATLEVSLSNVKTQLTAAKASIEDENVDESRAALQEARLSMVKLAKDIKTASRAAESAEVEE